MAVKVNFADVEDQRDYSPVPDAKYKAQVTNVKQAEVKSGPNAGATRFNIEFTLDTGEGEKYNNRKVFEGINLVKNSMWKLKALLTAGGFEVDEEMEIDAEDLVGTELVIEVGTDQKRNDPNDPSKVYPARNKVVKFYPYEPDEADLIS